MRKLGYARVSTVDQSLALQIHALDGVGCERIFKDEGISGAVGDRPGLNALIAELKRGDMLVVWRLDRLGRSLLNLVGLINTLAQKGVEFRSLNENIDTSSAGGRLVFHMMAALAEFERALISERTRAGMQAVRADGRHLGRPPSLTEEERSEAVAAVVKHGEQLTDVAERYQVHTRTIRRAIKDHLAVTIGPDPVSEALLADLENTG